MNFIKIGRKNPVFSVLLFFSLSVYSLLVAEQKLFTVELENKTIINVIKLESKDKDAFIQGKEVFLRSFYQAYSGYTADQLYLENKPDFLKNCLEAAFEYEETYFYNGKEGSLFIVVRNALTNEVIGFVSFDNTDSSGNKTLYIRKLAIDYAYRGKGIGKRLILGVIKVIAQNQPIVVTVFTHKIN